MSRPGALVTLEPRAWAGGAPTLLRRKNRVMRLRRVGAPPALLPIALRLPPFAEIASEFRPPETGARGGDITRFLEPERVPVCGGLFEPDPHAAVTNVLGLHS